MTSTRIVAALLVALGLAVGGGRLLQVVIEPCAGLQPGTFWYWWYECGKDAGGGGGSGAGQP